MESVIEKENYCCSSLRISCISHELMMMHTSIPYQTMFIPSAVRVVKLQATAVHGGDLIVRVMMCVEGTEITPECVAK